MLLTSLRMHNFKRYREQVVRFRDGITGIVGNNGSGKSTIVDAILFALYGVQGTGIDSEFIVNAFADPKAKAMVTLEFSIGGEDYTIQRTFGRRGGASHTARLYQGGRLLAKGVIPVQERIHRLQRMGPADFRHTIFSGQKDLSALLDTNREKRKDWFRKLLGIDSLKDDGGWILKEERDSLAARQERFLGTLEGINPETVKERLDATGQEIQETEESGAQFRREAIVLENRDSELARRLRDLEEARAHLATLIGERDHLRTEVQRLQADQEVLTREIADLERKTEEYGLLRDMEPAFGESKAALEDMRRRSTEKERVTGQMEAAGARLQELESQLALTRGELSRIQKDEAALEEIKPKLARREELLARLRDLELPETIYRGLREDLLRAEHDLEGARIKGTELRERIDGLTRDQERLDALEGDLADDLELREKATQLSRARELDLQLEGIRCQMGNADIEITQIRESIQELEHLLGEKGEVDSLIRGLEGEWVGIERGLADTTLAMKTRAKEASDMEQHLSVLGELGPDSPCPTCHRPIRDHYDTLLQELRQGRDAAIAAHDDLKSEYTRLLGERDRISGELTAMRAKKDLQKQEEGELRTQEARLKAREGDLRRLNGEAKEFMDAIHALGIERYDPAEHQMVREEMEAREEKRGEVARLRDACARMPDLRAEWKFLEEETIGVLSRKEDLEGKIRELGFDPAIVQDLAREREALDKPWQASLALAERIRRKGGLLEHEANLARNRGETSHVRDDLLERLESVGYDQETHQSLEEAFRQAQAGHERLLALAPLVALLPDRRGRLESIRAGLAAAERDVSACENQIAGFAFRETDLKAAMVEQEGLRAEIRRTGIALERCQGDLRRLAEQKSGLEASLARAGEISREVGEIRRQMELLDLTRDLIGRFTDHLLGVVKDRIRDETSRILSDITDGRYDTVLIDDDLTLLVHDLGGDFPAGRFSGGEQDDIAVALRVALSRYLAEMHGMEDPTFLIFDEIFGSQDEERRGNLFRALRTLETRFPQIFLISHIPDVQGEFSNLLLVEAGPDGTSTVRSPDDVG